MKFLCTIYTLRRVSLPLAIQTQYISWKANSNSLLGVKNVLCQSCITPTWQRNGNDSVGYHIERLWLLSTDQIAVMTPSVIQRRSSPFLSTIFLRQVHPSHRPKFKMLEITFHGHKSIDERIYLLGVSSLGYLCLIRAGIAWWYLCYCRQEMCHGRWSFQTIHSVATWLGPPIHLSLNRY